MGVCGWGGVERPHIIQNSSDGTSLPMVLVQELSGWLLEEGFDDTPGLSEGSRCDFDSGSDADLGSGSDLFFPCYSNSVATSHFSFSSYI